MRVERPWGWYEELLEAPGYKVKRLLVRQGLQLSLQRHHHRSESWTVVAEMASCFAVKRGLKPSLDGCCRFLVGSAPCARGQTDLVILEVQHGDWISEDDIERLQDDFGRVLQSEANL